MTGKMTVDVVPVVGKGLGCIARCDIARGQRCLAEEPLLSLAEGDDELAKSVAALSPAGRTAFSELSCGNEVPSGTSEAANAIMRTNCIPYRHLGRRYAGIFPTASRINHSCDSNACYKWDPVLEQLTVHATHSIRAMTEITFNYGFEGVYVMRNERQQTLRDVFGFECTCSKCNLTGAAFHASDGRMAALSNDVLLAELQALGRLEALKSLEALSSLDRLEARYALMRVESPSGHYHGCEVYLQAYAEWCANASLRLVAHASTLSETKERARLLDVAAAYLEGGRRWALCASEVCRDMCGHGSRAHRVWTEALEQRCWQVGGPAIPDFAVTWQAGLTAPPLAILLSWIRRPGDGHGGAVYDREEADADVVGSSAGSTGSAAPSAAQGCKLL